MATADQQRRALERVEAALEDGQPIPEDIAHRTIEKLSERLGDDKLLSVLWDTYPNQCKSALVDVVAEFIAQGDGEKDCYD